MIKLLQKILRVLIIALSSAVIAIFIMPANQTYAYCGDGTLETPQEECDDGNYTERDGCSSYCKTEDMKAPSVSSVSIPDNSKDISVLTKKITVTFSEEIKSSDVNTDNILLEYSAKPVNISVSLNSDKKTVTITVNEKLIAETDHAIKIKNIRDTSGNAMQSSNSGGYYISLFKTAKEIDTTPPTVVVSPPGGTYYFNQEVKLTPYTGSYTNSDEYIDKTAKIYYTLNDINLSEKSSVYSLPITISEGTTLRYFAADSLGNKTSVYTERYNLTCPEYANAKKATNNYPTCTILECNYGFSLKNNTCVTSFGNDEEDYKTNAATAPLLSSSTPMTITSRPSIYITLEHKGTLKRPIIFKDVKKGVIVEFQQNTEITDSDNNLFKGYLRQPQNLSMKNYPINYGYVFREIIEFRADDGINLNFSPAYKITIPYNSSFNYSEDAVVFQYNPKTQTYSEYSKNSYTNDNIKEEVIITANKTGIFFIAQQGQDYNKAVFNDITAHWAKNYIEELYRKGIVKGKAQGVYSPNDNLTRAEFVKIALLAIGVTVDTSEDIADAPFKDVPLYSWYALYIQKAKELNLIAGYGNNIFKPDKTINRAEAIKILLAAFKFDLTAITPATTSGSTPPPSYTDLKKTEWYFPYIDFAIKNEIFTGNEGYSKQAKLFQPGKAMTRGEMAKLAIKAIELSAKLKSK